MATLGLKVRLFGAIQTTSQVEAQAFINTYPKYESSSPILVRGWGVPLMNCDWREVYAIYLEISNGAAARTRWTRFK